MWEPPEVRTAAGELVAGTEDRLEVGTELRGLTQGSSPPLFSEARSGVWESPRAPLALGGGSGAPGRARLQSLGKGWGWG